MRCLALGLGIALASAAALAQPLTPCRLRGMEHEALCGRVSRALDPQRPDGVRIDVHYAVLPALARNKKLDPVFFFAGGPGQSVIELAGPLSAMLARFGNRRDIVLIDQRGTGRSAPLLCDADDPALPLAKQFDTTRRRERLAQCLAKLTALPHGDLRFFTTVLAAQDADAVRAALGAERINLVGASYGTRVALDYQRQFPARVRRSVLDGVAPPDMVLPRASSADNQAALEAVLAACEQDRRAVIGCALRYPQLRSEWQALLAGLPRTVQIAHPIGGRVERIVLTRDALLGLVRAPLYSPALAAALPQALDDAARDGRFEPLAALALSLGSRRGVALATGMHFSVVCAEDLPRLDGLGDAPGRDFANSFVEPYREVCATWPRGDVPSAFYSLPRAAAATLLLSGGADPATPPRHGARVAMQLGAKARHVVVAQAGHGVMGLPCMRDVIYRFVDAESDDDALKVDATCVQAVPRPPAFAPPEASSASGAQR